MLRFLTDEQISPLVAKQAARRGLDIHAIPSWQGGQFLSAPDDVLLQAAHRERRTLVTFDLRTIPPLLRDWAEQGIEHSGVILIDEKTVAPNNIGGIIAALCTLWKERGSDDWTGRAMFLRPARL